MRRLILTTLALTFLAAPAAYADTYQPTKHESRHELNTVPPKVEKTRVVRKTVVRPAWRIGRPVPVWQRKAVVRDYYRYGLHRPGRGLAWIKVGNSFLLIKTNSGVIVGIR